MRTTMKSTSRVAAIAVAGVLVATLAGCATGGPAGDGEAELSDEDVTLRMTWWGGDTRVQLTQEAIAAFEEEYPNITVEAEFSDWTGYWDRLATSTAGNNSPDVIQMDELYLASYADRGALYDLELTPQLDTSALAPGTLDLGRVGSTLYAYPATTTPFGFLVNEDLVTELGLSVPDTSTWTWDDLQSFAVEVGEASDGSAVGVSPMNNGFSLQLWARQNDEALFTDGDVSISPETLASYFQLALDWTESGAAASASRQTESAGAALEQTDFGTGSQAALPSQVTQISAYSAAAGDADMSIRAVPTDDENAEPYSYLKAGMYWAISSRSAHPAEAALLIDFLTNSPEAGEILGTERGIPANPEIREEIEPMLDENGQKSFAYIEEIEPILGDAPEVTPNGASGLDGMIQRYEQDVLFERSTPEEAADALIAELQSSIDAAS